jgi:hypothetical protein
VFRPIFHRVGIATGHHSDLHLVLCRYRTRDSADYSCNRCMAQR